VANEREELVGCIGLAGWMKWTALMQKFNWTAYSPFFRTDINDGSRYQGTKAFACYRTCWRLQTLRTPSDLKFPVTISSKHTLILTKTLPVFVTSITPRRTVMFVES